MKIGDMNDADVDYHRIARRIADDFDKDFKKLHDKKGRK